jgi:hypothetical protein
MLPTTIVEFVGEQPMSPRPETHHDRLSALYVLWSNPSYWTGAIRSREIGQSRGSVIVADDHAGIVRLEAIQDALIAGTPLTAIPEFQLWLAEGTKLPAPNAGSTPPAPVS